jgi:hypothetical protein
MQEHADSAHLKEANRALTGRHHLFLSSDRDLFVIEAKFTARL